MKNKICHTFFIYEKHLFQHDDAQLKAPMFRLHYVYFVRAMTERKMKKNKGHAHIDWVGCIEYIEYHSFSREKKTISKKSVSRLRLCN